jgi:hypothetical protein
MLLALVVTTLSMSSRADILNIVFETPSITVMPGETDVTMFGTLTNTDSLGVDLNGDALVVPEASSIMDNFANLPPFLDTGENSGLVELFRFDVASDAPLGLQIGSYSILGGVKDPFAFDVIGSQNFDLMIETGGQIPEPSSAVVLLTFVLTALGSRKIIRASGRM